MTSFLDTPIEFLKGVGPQRGELLRTELGVAVFGDLLQRFPFRYVDRSRFHAVSELRGEQDGVQLRGRVSQVRTVGEKQARRLTARLTDATGTIELVWFKGIRWLQPILKEGAEFIVFGKVTDFRGRLNMAHPELEAA
ncbi:MAG TPA: OB-fold nucleic acid binding domain-containing protein, partial [Flavobacteriales bacterium]|nr:OB-fold nucleic acid binding domain-containing protein [Flavobacteriales bacterium]